MITTAVRENHLPAGVTLIDGTVWAGVVVIDADAARDLLDRHDTAVAAGLIRRNRRLKRQNVSELASAMKNGTYVLTGEPLILDRDGIPMDGIHTLTACAETGVPIETLLVAGIDRAARDFVDAGVPRRAADVNYEHGSNDANTVTSVITFVLTYHKFKTLERQSKDRRPTRAEIIAAYDEFGQDIDAISNELSSPLLRRSLVAAIRYLAAENGLGTEAYEFFHAVKYGEGLYEGNPALALRRRIESDRMSKHQQKAHPDVVSAWYVKAFRAWARGEEMHTIRWRRIAPAREAFPQIPTLDEVS